MMSHSRSRRVGFDMMRRTSLLAQQAASQCLFELSPLALRTNLRSSGRIGVPSKSMMNSNKDRGSVGVSKQINAEQRGKVSRSIGSDAVNLLSAKSHVDICEIDSASDQASKSSLKQERPP